MVLFDQTGAAGASLAVTSLLREEMIKQKYKKPQFKGLEESLLN